MKWIREGERNTKFSHVSTICRRRRNKIVMLRDADGQWVDDPERLQALVRNYYIKLFSDTEGKCQISFSTPCPSILLTNGVTLDTKISLQEVRQALFQMKPWKAPGTDGFQSGFFHKFWYTVSMSLFNLVDNAFENGFLPTGVNDTLLVPQGG